MPTGRHNPYTPEGEIEQFGKFASGLNQVTGRRLAAYLLPALYVIGGVAVLCALGIAFNHLVVPLVSRWVNTG